MRTFEAVFGVLIMAAAVALALGVAAWVVPVPPPGWGLTLALASAGATVAAHGMAGRASLAASPGAAQRWGSAFYAVLSLTAAVFLPLVVEVLDLVTIAGFPLGYYFTAQGLLIAFAIIAFRAARSLEALEERHLPHSPPRDL